ncbi:MAG: sensor histidine kinase [Candidatus Hodarchaeales archaeon]|jgi:signal transduction histidine kinase
MNFVEKIFRVKPLLEEIIGSPALERRMQEKGIVVHVEVDENLEITSDRDLLKKVFQNLLNNSFDALETVKESPVVKVNSTSDGQEVLISFIDNGVGIQQENLDKVFEPFFTTKNGEGTGLGLSICQSIVEKHGGKITISSTLDKGTEVKVKLPIKK